MNRYDCEQWFKDIDMVIHNCGLLEELDALAGSSILITGAGGLIGSAIADVFVYYNETHDLPIRVFAGGRNQERVAGRFLPYCNRAYFRILSYDALREDNELPPKVDYIIHGAGNASPRMIMREPVETMVGNVLGLYHLLEYGKERGAKRVLYISSSEVYGTKEGSQPYGEREYGYIDLLNPRNSYSTGKRAAETLCVSYGLEYGVDSVIVRPGHIYGPTALEGDDRIASAFAYQAARGEDLVMKSEGEQIRSYCHCLDCAAAVIKVLLKGEGGQAYNISNPDSVITIKQMAELAAEAGGVRLLHQEVREEERKGFNPMSNSSLDSASLIGLGWKGCFDARTGILHTVDLLKELESYG